MAARADSPAVRAPSPAVRASALAFVRAHAWTLGLVGAAVAAILVRLPFLDWPLTGDEGNYAYTAYWWGRGETLYSGYLGLEKAQGVFLFYRAIDLVLGLDTASIRLGSAVWAALSAVAVGLVGTRLHGRAAGVVAAVLFAVFSAAPQVDGFTTNTEIMMVLPLTLSVWALLDRRFGWAGLLAGAGLLFKMSAAGGVLFVAFWLLYTRVGLRRWAQFGIGVALPVLLAAAHGMLTVGLPTYLYNVALFRVCAGWRLVPDPVRVALVNWLNTAVVWFPLALSGAIGLPTTSRRERNFVLAWGACSLLGVAMGGEWTSHYFVQIIPVLSVAAAAGLARLWRVGHWLVRAEAIVLLLTFLLVFQGPYFFASPSDGCWRLYHRPGLLVNEEAAAYIRAHTSENETFYVAFWQADVYHLAQRRSALPYISRAQLLGAPDGRSRALEIVSTRVPTYVLVLNLPSAEVDPDGAIERALEDNYEVETTFDGVPLYRRKP